MHLIQVTDGCQIPAQARPQLSDIPAEQARGETLIYLYNKYTLVIVTFHEWKATTAAYFHPLLPGLTRWQRLILVKLADKFKMCFVALKEVNKLYAQYNLGI